MRNAFLLTAIVTVILVSITVYSTTQSTKSVPTSSHTPSRSLSVVTTLLPLYEAARMIGGEYVRVSSLIPPGSEIHTYEPTARDVQKVTGADILFYGSRTLEPWIESLSSQVKSGAIAVSITDVMPSAGDGGSREPRDPHFWLDPHSALIVADTIESHFITRDPSHADYYRHNTRGYKKHVHDVIDAYDTTLSRCKTDTLLHAGHATFGNLAQRYSLRYVPLLGSSEDHEPTAADIAHFIQLVESADIRSVFVDKGESNAYVNTIARDTGATIYTLDAVHTTRRDDLTRESPYLNITKDNLNILVQGLRCSQ